MRDKRSVSTWARPFSTIAQLDESGNPVALPNSDDFDETPSLILLTEDHHVIVGPSRMRAAMEDPDHVVERIKREMGDVGFHRTVDGREITPEFLSALILKKLRQDAEKRIGKIGNAVITVPYYFNDVRRKATQDAGRIAGLNVVDIINEPTAATLTYAWHRGELGGTVEFEKPHRALVYDLGGGTFDVTVVEYTPNHFRVLATDGDGFPAWRCRLERSPARICRLRIQSEIRHRYPRIEANHPHPPQRLRPCKTKAFGKRLRENHGPSWRQSDAGGGDTRRVRADDGRPLATGLRTQPNWSSNKQRQPPKASTRSCWSAARRSCRRSLGCSKTCSVKNRYDELSPHTAVAQGAAIHAAILEVKERGDKSELAQKIRKMLESVKQENVNSHGLGIVANNPKSGRDINYVMIKRNTPLPFERTQKFSTQRDGQKRGEHPSGRRRRPRPGRLLALGQVSDRRFS